MRTAVFTIASRNYFAVVRTLMQSLEQTNSEYERYVAVADEVTEDFRKVDSKLNLLSISELNLPDEKKMLFRYDILELNTAIKPFVFDVLFHKFGYERVIYLDPDICTYGRFTELERCFDSGSEIILTPHLTDTYEDDCWPNELDILKSGTYNLGFLGLSKSENTEKMIHWWEKKLEFQCIESFKDGLFVDQKWMDLVPGMFEHVYILKNAGYNVAYWNMSHRKGSKNSSGKYLINGEPLVFFHFSGLNPRKIDDISKYQSRFTIDDIGVLREVFEQYAESVLENGYEQLRDIPYAFDFYESGERISNLVRKVYRENGWLQKLCGEDPFRTSAIFYKYRLRILVRAMECIWYDREDIRKIYPSVNSLGYVKWFLKEAEAQYGIADSWLKNIDASKLLKYENIERIKESGEGKMILFAKKHTTGNVKKTLKKIYKKNR